MSRKERSKLEVLGRIGSGQLTLAQGAELLGLSYRQMRRLRNRHVEEGDAGLVHRLRGKAGNRKTDPAVRLAVLKLYREKYRDFGPTLACEYLAKDGHVLSHDTLRRWLGEEGLMGRRRKRGKHRSRRDRRELAGQLVQMDGSPHDWFEGRCGAEACCLMVMIDDATGRVYARFYARETLWAAFDVFGRYAARYGLPRALYVDRAGIYRSDKPEAAPTQFGRAMAELGVELILANSPQAKGRVERMNQTLQDRLVKEMRLRGINTMEAGNALLEGSFLAELNERFEVDAVGAADAHRAVEAELSEVLCEQETRAVGRDWCVQWRGRLLQIEREHEALSLAGKRVIVRQKADGSLQLLYEQKKLSWRELKQRPEAARARKPVVNNKRYVPPAEHPWKRDLPAARPSAAAPPQPLQPEGRKRTFLVR